VWPPPGIEHSSIRTLVLVAGGVGINPLMSMISHIHQTNSFPKTVHFLYSTRRPSAESEIDDILFVRRLSSIADSKSVEGRLRLSLFLTGEKDDKRIDKIRGRLNVQKRRIAEHDLLACMGGVEDREGTVCYICGPSGMTDEFVDLVKEMPGMNEKGVFIEKWW
jgi:ferredoxin-NADP reductase